MNQRRAAAYNLFVFFLCVYLLTASGLSIYWSDVSLDRMAVAKAIVEKGDLSIPAGEGMIGKDGRNYSHFGIGSVLVALPFYAFASLIGLSPGSMLSILNQLFGTATAVLVFLFSSSLGYSRRASLVTSAAYGLGTMAWHYSKNPGDHAIETFCVLLSVYCMVRYLQKGKKSYTALSGGALGIALLTRPTSVLVIPALLILVYRAVPRRADGKIAARNFAKAFSWFFPAIVPFVAFDLWYNYYRFGSVWETGHSLMAGRMKLSFFTGTPLLTGLAGFLISPGKGFFYYTPAALLFFFSIRRFSRRCPACSASFVVLMITYVLFLSKNIYWHGDWAWGPRYLLVLTPFMIIPAAECFEAVGAPGRRGLKAAVCFLLGVSFIIQVASISVYHYRYFYRYYYKFHGTFTTAHAEGVQAIQEPPVGTYFDWTKSPILSQFGSIGEMLPSLRNPGSTAYPPWIGRVDHLADKPFLYTFDFWWLYLFALKKDPSGFVVAAILSLMAAHTAFMLYRTGRARYHHAP